MTKVSDLHKKRMKDPEYRKAHDELQPEFDLARAVIQARVSAGLTQQQLAERMSTTQSDIARLEARAATFPPGSDRIYALGRGKGYPVIMKWNALRTGL
jgi:ribosome-binding protein aMBF1 (putative translation factor)